MLFDFIQIIFNLHYAVEIKPVFKGHSWQKCILRNVSYLPHKECATDGCRDTLYGIHVGTLSTGFM